MARRAITPASVPRTFDDLVREVNAVLFTGRADIERAWVRTYHEIGRLINVHILENRARANYGGLVYERLSRRTGVSVRTLRECAQFHRCFPIRRKSAELGWSHYVLLCQVGDPTRREKLAVEAERNAWKTGQLEARVRALNAAIDVAATAPGASDGAPAKPAAKLLTPRRGTPALHLVVDRGDEGLAIDLGFKVYRRLGPNSKLAAGDIVRLAADGSVRRADDATKADLFTYAATLRRVIDGDTLVVTLEVAPEIFVELKLRLRGLNCPELSTPEGKAAKRFVGALVAQSTAVIIHTTKPDKYDRYLADVFLRREDGTDIFLNNALLENGHAEPKEGWEFRDWEKEWVK